MTLLHPRWDATGNERAGSSSVPSTQTPMTAHGSDRAPREVLVPLEDLAYLRFRAPTSRPL